LNQKDEELSIWNQKLVRLETNYELQLEEKSAKLNGVASENDRLRIDNQNYIASIQQLNGKINQIKSLLSKFIINFGRSSSFAKPALRNSWEHEASGIDKGCHGPGNQ
jgi:hypothetical protein